MSRFGIPLLLSLLLVAGQAGAADAAKAAQFFEEALSRYERDDTTGAVVQLKNALQQDGRLLQAHVLMGRAQLKLGNPTAAEASFDTALSLGADRAEIALELAQAYFAQGKFRELAERISPLGLSAEIQQALLLLRAYAFMEMGDMAGAENTLAQAGNHGKSADYLVARGMLSLQQRKLPAARDYADQALKLDGKHAKAWNLLASIDHLQGASQNALRGYATALEYQPTLADARVARAGLLLDLNRIDELGKELALLRAKNPGDPRGTYLESIYLSRTGKPNEAKAALLETARLIDALPPEGLRRRGQLLMLGGLSHYELRSSAKAQKYLENYLKLHAEHVGAHKMLGSLYLKDNQTEAAVSMLERAVRLAPNDPDVLTLLASGYLMRNQPAKAANLLEQASAAQRSRPELSATLGFSLLGVGRAESGLQYINQAFRQRPSDARLANSLVMLHIQQGQARQAIGVAEALLNASQRKAPAYNLLGVAKAAARDFPGARAAYQKALTIDPALDPARLNLGKLESSLGQHDAARQHFTQLIKRDARHAQAQFELARTDAAAGRLTDAISRLEKLYSVNNGVHIALQLGDYHLANNQAGKALEVAKTLSGRYPDHYQVLSLLGRSHAASGRDDLARGAFGNMGKQAGFDIELLAETARLQMRLNDLAGASLSLNKALTVSTTNLDINLLLAERDLRKGDSTQALGRVRQLATLYPKLAEPHRMLGDIASAQQRHAEAVGHYRAALERSDAAEVAVRLFESQSRTGDLAGALKMLEDWSRRHPNSGPAQLALADGWLRANRLDQARAAYERYLKQHGEQAHALNNLALVLHKQGDFKTALRHAQRAYQLAPESPISNDTLGWLLTRSGEHDRALRHLRDARTRVPQNSEIRYHLAVALQNAGRKNEAIKELEAALKRGDAFEGSVEARRLLEQLQR